jgi:hypothetical protein
LFAGACAAFLPAHVAGQAPSTPALFHYTADQLACSAFHETSRGRLETQTGSRIRRETLTRDGTLRVRAQPAGSAIAIEAWYDSLTLGRESPETNLTPDTDGFLGGRYRGRLTFAGRYSAIARPFVPDEVAEVADMSGALDDILQPMPLGALGVGDHWSDSSGLELRRLPDSLAGRRVVQRLDVHSRRESHRATIRGDTASIPARQVTVEEGRVDWDPRVGLLRRVRHLVVETTVPAGGPVAQPVRTRLEQDVRLMRLRSPACAPESPAR